MTNPWFPTTAAPDETQPDEAATELLRTGAAAPQPAVPNVDRADRLEEFTPSERPRRLWVIGAHGGAGESTIADVVDGSPTQHRWPRQSDGPAAVLVARTHHHGLRRAQLAMRTWASGQTPPLKLIGLILVADAPGRLPKELDHFAQTLGGGVPHIWRFPWVEALRTIDASQIQPPRQVTKILTELNTVLSSS